jgi:hypothetical protein
MLEASICRLGVAFVWLCLAAFNLPAEMSAANASSPLTETGSWEAALDRMPLEPPVTQLTRTNCVEVMLRSFQSNRVVKALIFMPGATDEFYMFRRASAHITTAAPTLFDAVRALTNQTFIRVAFQPPLLLLHTDEDPLDPIIKVEDTATAERLKPRRFVPHALYNDRDWETLQPVLKRRLKVDIRPWRYSTGSWHFYRHSFAAWDLTGWEALETTAFAGKTTITIRHKRVIFEPDRRVRAVPKLDFYPR